MEDLEIDKILLILLSIFLKMVWNIMRDNYSKFLLVIDENERLVGIFLILNLILVYMDIWDNNILGKSNILIENIIDIFVVIFIYINENVKIFDGKIVVIVM